MELLDTRVPSRFAVVNIYQTKKDHSNDLIANLKHSNEPFDLSHLHDLSIESNKINKTRDSLREKIDYFEDIRKTDLGLQIFVKGQKNPLPLSSMGDGFSSLLKLTFMNNFLDNGIIILEEPESSLHPGFLYLLCEAMISNSQESQFFISTHSIDFIKTILKVAEWSNQLSNVQIIRMHSQPDGLNLDLEMISGDCAKDEIENIGRDLRGI
jgi:AAA15 family ATPase/GTPase